MSRLRRLVESIRSSGRAALIPYLTAGDPSIEDTVAFAGACARGGADVLELGIPFSDPLADGPVIQRAVARSLAAGTTVSEVLECARRIHREHALPTILMTYVNPVLAYGWPRFVADAAEAGCVGVLLTDVPAEEFGEFLPALREAELGTILLVAPTSSPERVPKICALATGFVYVIGRLGVTGVGGSHAESFAPSVRRVRAASAVPVGVGFGISTAAQAAEVAGMADAVIVGSALVQCLESAANRADGVRALENAVKLLRAGVERPLGPVDAGKENA